MYEKFPIKSQVALQAEHVRVGFLTAAIIIVVLMLFICFPQRNVYEDEWYIAPAKQNPKRIPDVFVQVTRQKVRLTELPFLHRRILSARGLDLAAPIEMNYR